eukprot:387826-Rhodomonas_salina.1
MPVTCLCHQQRPTNSTPGLPDTGTGCARLQAEAEAEAERKQAEATAVQEPKPAATAQKLTRSDQEAPPGPPHARISCPNTPAMRVCAVSCSPGRRLSPCTAASEPTLQNQECGFLYSSLQREQPTRTR